MNLNTALNYLVEMKLVHDTQCVSVVMNKGRSLNSADKLFDCKMNVVQAKRFFGKFDVILSKVITEGEYHTPVFMFILSDEEK